MSRTISLLTTILLLSLLPRCADADESSSRVSFSRQIRPLLSDRCFACHGPDEMVRQAELRLDERASLFRTVDGVTIVQPSQPDQSELLRRITTDDADEVMPPPDSDLQRLNPDEVRLIEQWIAEGAAWEEHWSFVPPLAVQPPEFAAAHANPSSDELLNPIDRFVVNRLNSLGLTQSPEAPRGALIRRVSFALTGLPPTPDEVAAYLNDPADNDAAFESVVDRMLASPHYGERMALAWLEAARYADTDGYQNDGPRTMWPWRDWVINAYNSDMPFDQFTVEQLAGDLLPDATRAQIIATGFNRNHRYNSEAGLVLEEFLLENAVDRVDTTSTVWMGLTMGCARCHDHKYDPFSQREYYQLIAYFNNVSESGRAVKFGNSEPWIAAPTKQQEKRLEELKVRYAEACEALAGIEHELDAQLDTLVAEDEPDAAQPPHDDFEGSVVRRGMTHRFPLDELEDGLTIEAGRPAFREGMRGQAATFGGSGVLSLGKVGNVACQQRSSISFWLRPTDVADGVIVSRQQSNSRRAGFCIELHDGHLQFFIITRWLAGVGAVETVTTLDANQWVHVAVTNDGSQSAKGMRIYLNGKEAETRTLYNTNSNTGGTSKNSVLRLGGGVIGSKLRGQVDELRFYDRTLWGDEIRVLAVRESVNELLSRSRQPGGVAVLAPGQRDKLRAWLLEMDGADKRRDLADSRFQTRMAIRKLEDSIATTMVMDEVPNASPTHVRLRGAYNKRGEEVSRNVPATFPPMPKDSAQSRLGFARWLVSGQHPLTARVAVNRYWQMHFGRGLVGTPEDWGAQGESPSHPALLDWLATEFVASGWDIKAMQKRIVTSRTWRQQSTASPDLWQRDPQNELLARGPRLRLSAQAIRDQALAVSGLLVRDIGGPSVSPYQPAGLWDELSNMKYRQSKGADLYRRSLYTIWKRTLAPPAMAVLDSGDRETCKVRPIRTNTPLQALTTLNETGFVEAARQFGKRMMTEGGGSPSDRIAFGFQLLLARNPTTTELELLGDSLQTYRQHFRADENAARELAAVGESKAPADVEVAELAAFTMIANTLLNLDETLTPK